MARQAFPLLSSPLASNPAPHASSTPRCIVAWAISLAISSRPSRSEESLEMPALRTAAGSYGCHTATGSHTVRTVASPGPSRVPATAIALAASADPSKHSRTRVGERACAVIVG